MSNRNAFVLLTSLLLVGCMLLSLPAAAQSQATSGQITGVVKDGSGAVVPGATVSVVNTATGFKQSLASNEAGFYRAVLLPPGRYDVTVSAKGFQPSVAKSVEIGVGRTTDLNFALSVGARPEMVTVTAEMIETTRHEEAAFVGATIISSLPLNGRRFQDITNTTPTAQTDPSRGGISMTGQRMVNTAAINVDGTDYGQLFFGGIRGGERAQFAPTIPLDAVQEFQIVRAGYSAEFGRSTGGVITALTKSGTNAYHGGGQYVIRPDVAGRNTQFYKLTESQLVTKGCTTCIVNPNPTLMQWGGSVGGPIKKDKLFFFGSYDQQRQRIPHQIFFDKLTPSAYTPTAQTTEAYNLYKSFEQPFEQTNDAYLFLIKGDYQISNKHRLSVRYNHSNYQGINANSVGTSLSPTVSKADTANATELDKTRTVAGNLSSFFSHFANEFRGQYARETRPRLANSFTPGVSNSIGTFGTTSYLGQNTEYDYRIQFGDSLTWMKGNHSVKFGGEYSHLFADQTFGFNQYGVFGWKGSSDAGTILKMMGKCGNATCTTTANRFDDVNAYYDHQIGNLAATLKGEQFAVFVQDSWRVRPNFTLNYGLRWEAALNPTATANNAMTPLVNGFTFPSGITQNPGVIPNQTTQFQPRLGFSWDPKGNGKTVVRGFGGMYYAPTPLILYAASVNNFREPAGDLSIRLPIQIPAVLTPAQSAALVAAGCPNGCKTVYNQLLMLGSNFNLNNYALDQLPNPTAAQIMDLAGKINQALGKPFNPYNGAQPYFTRNDYTNPRSYQAGFGVEREVTRGWTVALEGTWIKTVHLERDTDLNLAKSTSTDIAGRQLYSIANRPIPTLGMVIIRDSSAKSLYRGLTFRTAVNKRWGQINAYYTLSSNLDDDYQERSATGVYYEDRYNWRPDYGFSDLNRRHQFVLQSVFNMHWDFELSSAIKFASGWPLNPTLNSDVNGDGENRTDRPYWAYDSPAIRNSFTNMATSNIDLGVSKHVKIAESKQLKFAVQMFNLFNLMNLTYSGTTATNFCSSGVTTCGIPAYQAATASGNNWAPNQKFMKLRDSAGNLLLDTTSSNGAPFEAQFSVHFIF